MANLLILGSLLPKYSPDFAFNVIKVFFHKMIIFEKSLFDS